MGDFYTTSPTQASQSQVQTHRESNNAYSIASRIPRPKQLTFLGTANNLLDFFSPKNSLCPLDLGAKQFLRRPTTALGRLGERKDLLGQFRFRLFPSRLWPRGKQAGFARLLHQLLGAEQGGEMPGNAVQRGWSRMSGAMLFRVLDLFPVSPDLIDIFDFHAAEHVRMAADQLFGDVPRHLVEVEGAAFLRQLA